MAEYTGPATDNEAVVIDNGSGRKVPDLYATGDCYDEKHENHLKFGTAHPKIIHNDIYGQFLDDSEPMDPH